MFRHARLQRPRLFLVYASLLALAACRGGDKVRPPVEVQVHYVGFDPAANSPVVVLQEKGGEKTMPIWIGVAEAQSIALQLRGATPPRPLTHDLLKTILDQAGVGFDHVVVNNLKDGAYYARIHLLNGQKPLEVDSRPSDAIALAMRFHRLILVERALFDAAPTSIIATEQEAKRGGPSLHTSAKVFGVTVQTLSDALAQHFGLPDTNGVLVTDVEGEHGGAHLQRGDVIVAVSGKRVRGIDDFQHHLHDAQGQAAILRVRREDEEIDAWLALTPDDAANAQAHTQEESE
jgi:bifunctional DNase/RNase